MILEGDEGSHALRVLLEHFQVQRLHKAGIDDRRGVAFVLQAHGQLPRQRHHRPQAQNRHVRAILQHLGLAQGNRLRSGLAGHSDHRTPRIANRARSRQLEGGLHHVGQFILVLGSHQHDLRNPAQVADVKQSMMRGAVVAREPGAIHAKQHRQLLQANVMHNGIEAPLQKCRVNGANRTESPGSHAGCEYHRMFLGDAHVEVAFGKLGPEQIEPSPAGHGRRDGHNALILAGQCGQGIGKNLGIAGPAGRLGMAGLGIVGPQPVKLLLLVQRRLKAASLLRQHVQQHGAVCAFQKLEALHQQRQIVPVDGAKVLQAEFLKQNRGPQHALGGLFGAAGQCHCRLAADLLHNALGRCVQVLVVLVGHDLVKIAGDGAHVAVDGPLVVVQHHDHPLGLRGDVVQRFN